MSTNRKRIVILLAIAVTIALVVIALLAITQTPSTPSIEVTTTCSINPTTVKLGELATITCATKSNDTNKAHTIMVKFSIQPTESISFIMGSPSTLTNPVSNVWQYNYTLNPLATYSQPTTVNASLQSGYFSAGYEIQVTFYMDNNQLNSTTTLYLFVSKTVT